MPATAAGPTVHSHPSPHRDRVRLTLLSFGLCGGPVAWAIQLELGYALASHACFPHYAARNHVLPGWHDGTGVLLLNIAALLVAAAATLVSWRNWVTTRQEHPGRSAHLLDRGEGRTRFLAACGVMAGIGFFAATAFNTVALLTVPPCAG